MALARPAPSCHFSTGHPHIHVVVVSEFPLAGRHPRGGVESSTLRLVGALSGTGTSVSVVAPAASAVAETVHDRDGVTVVHVGGRERFSLARSLRPWRRRAVRAIRGLEPDLVHGQGVLTGGLPACDVGMLPTVVTAHGDPCRDTWAAYEGLGRVVRTRLRSRLARQVVLRADAIVGVHPDWRVNLPSSPRRFEHIPNIVDACFYEADAAPHPGRVLYCGGPARIKGWDVLARAWPDVRRAVPGASLRAAGWPAPVAGGAGAEASGGITLLPVLPSAALAAELAAAAAVVIPSRYEVAPLVLSEAWAVGTPVVATTAGGLATLARGAAALVPSDDASLLAAAIVRVLEGEDSDTPAAVDEGRRRAQGQTAVAVAAAHRSLYDRLTTPDD